MELIWEKAREVGRLIAQSDEYRAFQRANARLGEDRDVVAGLNRLSELEESFAQAVQQGSEPPLEAQQEFERLAQEVQVKPSYQGFAAARENFDRLMVRIQEEIARGIQAGEQSRIILPS